MNVNRCPWLTGTPVGRIAESLPEGAKCLRLRYDLPAAVLVAVPRSFWPIVENLLLGVVDTAASRRLNVSPRTYSRRVTELLDQLGVSTRFQAGVEIGRIVEASSAAAQRAPHQSRPDLVSGRR